MLSRFELRRFRGVLPKLALIFAMLVPVMYGAVYLAANWDPYGNLKNLPVAIVNDDEAVTYDGTAVHAGADIQAELIKQDSFQWHAVLQREADDGLREGRYYLVLHIPRDFSATLVSGASTEPQRANITIQRNDANGFVIGSVTGQAQSKIENAVDRQAVDAYFKAVFKNLGKIRTGIQDAYTGSDKITQGLREAKGGSGQLLDGLRQADAAAGKLRDGALLLKSSMPQLVSGAQSLQGGLDQLSTGSSQLTQGANQVAGGTQQLYDTVGPVLDGVAQASPQIKQAAGAIDGAAQAINQQATTANQDLAALDTALQQLAQSNPALKDTQAYRDATSRLAQAQQRSRTITSTTSTIAGQTATINQQLQQMDPAARAAQAKSKLQQLNNGAHQVASGAASLHQGIDQADQGAARLTTGATQASDGVGQLSDGLGQLAEGTGKLVDGCSNLDGGLAQLTAGSTQLTDGLGQAVKQVPAVTGDQADHAALVLSSPVDVVSQVLNPANVYGRGLAPLFFSIAMWVFGISGFLVMRPISGRLLAGRLDPVRLTVSAYVPFGSVAVAGSLIMLALTWATLGLAPVHPLAALGLTVLVAVVFSLIAHLMRTAFGLPGSALLLVWLIFQLSSTGGTYPPAVLPGFFAAINPIMPITYSIDAFRFAISGGAADRFWIDVVVLAGIGAAALALDSVAVGIRQRFRIRDLHPPLTH